MVVNQGADGSVTGHHSTHRALSPTVDVVLVQPCRPGPSGADSGSEHGVGVHHQDAAAATVGVAEDLARMARAGWDVSVLVAASPLCASATAMRDAVSLATTGTSVAVDEIRTAMECGDGGAAWVACAVTAAHGVARPGSVVVVVVLPPPDGGYTVRLKPPFFVRAVAFAAPGRTAYFPVMVRRRAYGRAIRPCSISHACVCACVCVSRADQRQNSTMAAVYALSGSDAKGIAVTSCHDASVVPALCVVDAVLTAALRPHTSGVHPGLHAIRLTDPDVLVQLSPPPAS